MCAEAPNTVIYAQNNVQLSDRVTGIDWRAGIARVDDLNGSDGEKKPLRHSNSVRVAVPSVHTRWTRIIVTTLQIQQQ